MIKLSHIEYKNWKEEMVLEAFHDEMSKEANLKIFAKGVKALTKMFGKKSRRKAYK